MGLRTRSTLAASGAGGSAATCVALCAVTRAATIAAATIATSRSAVLYSHPGYGHCTSAILIINKNKLYLCCLY